MAKEASEAKSSTSKDSAVAKKTAKKAAKPVKELKEAELTAEAVVENEAPEVKLEAEVAEEQSVAPKKSSGTAKAGKRSAKAVKESEEKQAKEARKAETKTDEKPKLAKKPTRSKAERAGKKYREAVKLIEKEKVYSIDEALDLAIKTSTTKFDATVEMHINLGVDPRQADQNVRDTVVLPAGTGKTIRIAVMADEDEAKAAKTAGADVAGTDNVIALLEKEQLDFEVLIATPAQMPKLGKYARLLGPRGLMPNPKSGTVTPDVSKAVKEAKAGKVEYRVDQAGIVHLGIGKVSFGKDKLKTNAEAIVTSIKAAKPASAKGTYVKSAHITTSMGPSIKFELV